MSAHKADEPAVAEEIRRALGIPEHVAPISLLPLGYPDESPEPKEMKPLKEMISHDSFGRR
jgi:nitroreductase